MSRLATTILAILTLAAISYNFLNKNSKEKERLNGHISDIQLSISNFDSQKSELEKQKYTLYATNTAISVAKKAAENQIDELKSQLADYTLNHKLATLALIGGGGSAAALVINDNLTDKQRAFLGTATVLAAGYALFNSDEIKEVSSEITDKGVKITALKAAVEVSNKQIEDNNNSINIINQKINNIDTVISQKKHDLQTFQNQLNSIS
jgi:chromosome segregation ATPase